MKKTIYVTAMSFLVLLSAICSESFAGELDTGYSFEAQGRLEDAAEFFCSWSKTNPSARKTPEALLRCARLLDTLSESFSEKAEKRCYWGKKGSPACMHQDVSKLNAKYGAGSFKYEHSILYISYTGIHYREILNRFSRSKYAAEADFYILLRELVGHPDTILPRIKGFLSRHSGGEWNRKGLLLWARVNEDIWYVHRKWSWVLYNYQISPDELTVRAEPYRQEALRTYKKLMGNKKTFEGQSAAREYAILNAGRDDGQIYSIVNDSNAGTIETWGIQAPSARRTVVAPGSSPGGYQSPAVTPAPTLPPAGNAGEPIEKSSKMPQRWN
ncbi:MAG: hypothetical protein HN337_01605 [Deltaproteobacteria bacterium]|jgi:hypothetical protein|nr:hypothetical protein [Deltaproteobacteria bacterium]